jgi:hypothetical protein
MLREYILEVRVKFARSSRDVRAEITEIYGTLYPTLFDERKANRNSFTMCNFSHASICTLKLVYLEMLGVHKSFGARGDVVFKALRYKQAGRGFDSRRCHWNFSVT